MGAATPLCILVTEDHQDTLDVTALLLRHSGHTVYTARTAAEARELAAAGRCDLLVGETALPDFSGLDLMRELRERYGLRVIAVSAYASEGHVRDALAAGFSRHFAKPIAYSELLAAVDELTAAPVTELQPTACSSLSPAAPGR